MLNETPVALLTPANIPLTTPAAALYKVLWEYQINIIVNALIKTD